MKFKSQRMCPVKLRDPVRPWQTCVWFHGEDESATASAASQPGTGCSWILTFLFEKIWEKNEVLGTLVFRNLSLFPPQLGKKKKKEKNSMCW